MQLGCIFKRIQLFAILVAAISILAVLMLLFFFNYPSIARTRIIDALVFRNDTDSMERFLTTKDIKNLQLSFYIYNVTNPEEVVRSSAKIHLQEIGPFVYSEFKHKELINNNQTSGLITYKLRRRYILNRELSIADPTKLLVTWPNVPLIVARDYLDRLPFIARATAYFILNNAIKAKNEQPFIQDTVENFIFDGSKRELFEYLQSLDKLKFINPWPLKDNKFALLYGKNDTWNPDLDFTMTSSAGFGIDQTYHDLNMFTHINGSSTLPFWYGKHSMCNIVGGTDGEFFSPFLNSSDNVEVFSIDICRRLTFKFSKEYNFRGINNLKYTLDPKCLVSGSKNPSNQCYCLNRTPDGQPKLECQYDGLIDLSTCNFPNVVASGAHFLYGSQKLIDNFNGLSQPNLTLHEPTLYLEPNTGLSIKVRVPIQFNVRLEKGGFQIFNSIAKDEPLIIPLVWVAETSEMTDEQADTLRDKLLLLDSWLVTMVLGATIISVMAILTLASILVIRFRDSRRFSESTSETEPLIYSAENETSSGKVPISGTTGTVTDSQTNYQTV